MWTLGGIRIYTQDLPIQSKNTIARLQPLSGGTILQKFGHESSIYKLAAIVVGDTNMTTLSGFVTTTSGYTLVGPNGSLGDFYAASFNAKQRMIICQSIDQLQSEDTPVYDIEMELYPTNG